MSHHRSSAIALLLTLSACAGEGDGTSSTDDRKRPPDAGVVVVTSDAAADASTPTSSAGSVSCYYEANPSATCSAPAHCCFSNYSSQHNGECSTSTCGWGRIDCDGPEDCAGGQHCCSHQISNPTDGITGYAMSCQSAACGPAPTDYELCHTQTCSNGGSCVSAYGTANDLPRSLSICR